MSTEKEKNVLQLNKASGSTVSIKPHPREILDLGPETVAIARMKLQGFDFENVYGAEDRVSSLLMVKQQSQKIRDLFGSIEGVRQAFATEKKTAQAQKDMVIDGIDLEFAKGYCQKRQIDFVDDVDALIKVGFESERSGDANV